LDDFLILASNKFVIPPIPQPKAQTAEEYYGIFSCEFWGKKRAGPYSGRCVSPEEAARITQEVREREAEKQVQRQVGIPDIEPKANPLKVE